MDEAPVEVGQILAGKFKVERVLGVGGMGVVVAAMHLHLDKRVAIKFMLDSASKNEEVVARFLREAKAAARLRNQHIAQVLDVGAMDSGAPYMVLEYLEGADLEQVIEERMTSGRGPLPFREAVDYVMQACLGMAEAHSHDFVHRDLKPPNLFRTTGPDGQPLIKILDFGIAKAALDGIATKTQATMGSPFYMSPEQWGGAKGVDERGDIWALGAILQYLLSGSAPFEGDSLPTLFVKIASEPPASLATAQLNVPQGLQEVVLQCLQKSPADRPQDVSRLAALLVPFGSDQAGELARQASALLRAGPRASTQDGNARDRLAKTIAHQGAVPAPVTGAIKSTTTLSGGTGQLATASVLPETKRTFKLPMIGAAVLLLAGGAFLATSTMNRDSSSRTGATQAAAASTPADGATQSAPPVLSTEEPERSALARITVEIGSTPSGAVVYRAADSVRIGETPFTKEYAPGDGMLDLVLKLPGHKDVPLTIALIENAQEQIAFEPIEKSRPDKNDIRRGTRREPSGTDTKTSSAQDPPVKVTPSKTTEPANTKHQPTGIWEEDL